MTKPYEKAVQRSAALLDEKRPGWWDGGKRKKINLNTLALEDCDKCILGQLWGTKDGQDGFSRGMDALGLWSADRYVFAASIGAYPTLTRRWREEIERRRSAA